jgi:hypothetical protein
MTDSRFGLDTVRKAVRRSVDRTSLRQVADEIPMSFSGLRSFLEGGTPQPATRGKLVAWYSRSRGKRSPGVQREDVNAAIELLRAYVAEDERPQIRARRRREITDLLG